MACKLSILIPCHKSHVDKSNLLLASLRCHDVEVLRIINNGEKTKGHYRNELLGLATGEYLCFVDADDKVSSDYIDTLLKGIETKPDCISLRGEYYENCEFNGIFEHSIKYKEYKATSNKIKYERYPNHLNCIKSSIAKRFKFKEINHGEDTDWATQIYNSGLLKKEYYTDKILYYYLYNRK